MAIIIKSGVVNYRGRITECGTCGCKSNLWASNSSRFEGRLVCPGNKKYPDLHFLLWKKIEILYSELPDSVKEQTTIEILEIRARLKTVQPDVVNIDWVVKTGGAE